MDRVFCILLVVFTMFSCSPKITSYSGEAAFTSQTGVPDYGKIEYWAAHPAKNDPSDTIPFPLRTEEKEKQADVFYLHPTTLLGTRGNGNDNAKIDDPYINYKTDYSPIIYQASAFNKNARVFAPRYRQAHIGMYSEKDSASKYAAFNLAYEDVKNAFLYYLENENNGRPIIIASHSQGTTHATRLLKEFFDGKELSGRLVCAYLIGMGVRKDSYKKIPVCTDSTKTGCYVSWRTYRKDYTGEWVNRLDTSIVVVNPVTWKTTNEIADKSLQKGAVLYNLNKVHTKTQNSQAEGNALWVSHPKFPGSFLYRNKNYHAGDINLFYVDVREDASRRIKYYLLSK